MTKFERDLRAAFERTVGANACTQALAIIRGGNPWAVKAAQDAERQSYHPRGRHAAVMTALDALLGTHGVESLGDVDMRGGPPVEYLNTGDTYAATLVWYRDRARPWAIESWGDVAERLERA